jgi:hypothetical protein
MKVTTEIDNNFGYEKITQLVDNIPLNERKITPSCYKLPQCFQINFIKTISFNCSSLLCSLTPLSKKMSSNMAEILLKLALNTKQSINHKK